MKTFEYFEVLQYITMFMIMYMEMRNKKMGHGYKVYHGITC